MSLVCCHCSLIDTDVYTGVDTDAGVDAGVDSDDVYYC